MIYFVKSLNIIYLLGIEWCQCEFCSEPFDTVAQKNVHTLNHFKREICEFCDQNLIRIAGALYVLHSSITCIRKHIKEESEVSINEHERSVSPFGSDDPIAQCNETEPEIKLTEYFECDAIDVQTECFDTKQENNSDEEFDDTNGAAEVNEVNLNVLTGRQSDQNLVIINELVENDFDDEKNHEEKCDISKYKISSKKSPKPMRQKIQQQKKATPKLPNESVATKRESGQLECKTCKKVFSSMRSLRMHTLRVHEPANKKYVCTACGKSYCESNELVAHQSHKILCIICGETFCARSLLAAHRVVHEVPENDETNKKKFHCKQPGCNEMVTAQEWVKHFSTRHSESYHQFECDICHRRFRTKTQIQSHILCVHCPSAKTFKCDMCDYTAAIPSILTQHKKKTHFKKRTFMCSECGKVFCAKNQLVIHSYQHSGAKPFACPYEGCEKRFRGQPQRIEHMRMHTGEKPFECPVDGCDRRYSYSIDLKRHKFSAHGIYTKKYPCKICSDVFPENMFLKRHMKKHENRL